MTDEKKPFNRNKTAHVASLIGIDLNSTDDWTKDFEKLLKNIRFVDKTSFEEVPGDVQLKAFIAEQRERAREEERLEYLKKRLADI